MQRLLIPLLVMLLVAVTARGMGEEDFGNQPLAENNYEAWPAVMAVINDSHRVYHWWVNGNEQFFYHGDSEALNQALKNFSKVKSDRLEVLLRPGPGVTSTFAHDKKIEFHWSLHLIGGITAHMATRDQGQHVWATHPILTIYVGDGITLGALEIPEGLSVLQLDDLQNRYANGLASKDQTVRGWTCGVLAELDPYNQETMNRLAAMLADESDWVRLNAAGAIATYGTLATAVVKELQAAVDSEDELLSQRVKETIASVAAATPEPELTKQHQKTLEAIAEYCESR